MTIPFRIKLTLIIATMILVVLTALFTIVQKNIESEFRLEIESQIEHVSAFIEQSMNDRYELLRKDAIAAAKDSLVRDILTDTTLSTETILDIVQDEVFPKFDQINVIAITNSDGQIIASSDTSNKVTDEIFSGNWFEYVFEGEDIAGFVLVEGIYHQAIAMPVFHGNQMIGVMIVTRILGEEMLTTIAEVSPVDMALLDGNQRVSSTAWSDSVILLDAFDHWMLSMGYGEVLPKSLMETILGEERFLLRFIEDETQFVPPFVIARSLDEALIFVRNIRDIILLVGLAAIIISISVGFFVSVGISRPIQKLQKATTEIAKENFNHQVRIRSRDEFAQLGHSFNEMIKGLGEKQQIRSAFDKSVSKEIADHMLEQGVELGGVSQNTSILFSDIRGFTQLAEHMDEKQLIILLNEYFTAVNQSIMQHKGLIDKFIGDAVMALFGSPVPLDNSSVFAINAGLDMLEAVKKFNKEVAINYDCEIKIGIGINTGSVVAGLVGSKERLNFTVLGDHVNLASRIEGLSKYYGADLVVSELCLDNFYQHTPDDNNIVFRFLDTVKVKGRSQGMSIYQPIQVSENKKELIDNIKDYEIAVNLVKKDQLEKAEQSLTKLRRVWSDDRPTEMLLANVNSYLKDRSLYLEEYKEGIRVHTSK